ncbi:MAG: dienelactone hydrolase [Phenylobacterium sp.]|uniref:dienelactone hydrolase family protein n=1 Tax=Phenylobacterium sp. TaxID=1871053 RepID=UPI0025D93E98|nr:dienelactone hydrolase family protein [Phenylobacterium sp.]MBI1199756.1 dienelactone hydrolase [Phenylobacterium sp.]
MDAEGPANLSGYERRAFKAAGLSCPLFVSRAGREPVIVLHELPSITPQVAHLAEVLGRAGFRIYMPSFLGRPGAVPNLLDQAASLAQACVRSEILALKKGDHTRRAVAGLRVMAAQASAEAGGAKVGVLGLCLTGGFALATALEPTVAAAVASEPSLPLKSPADIDLSPADQATLKARIREGDLRAILLRFQDDAISPCERLRRYGDVLEGGVASRCLPKSAANPAYRGRVRYHCVLTNELIEEAGSDTVAVRNEVISFFDWRLRGGPAPAPTHDLPDCLLHGCVRRLPGGPKARPTT